MKENFIKSTIILILGGLITKILGLFIKIITTRIIGIDGISLYSLILPTFTLAMTITGLSLPISISKLVSEDKYNNKKIISSSIPIILITNILVIITLILTSKFISLNLLHDKRCIYPIMAISITLPFISMSSLIRSYFFGKQHMLPHVISNVIEQITRIILIIVIIPSLIKKSTTEAVCGLILINIISESISFLILLLFIPNKNKINKKDITPNKEYIKNILYISLPNTSGRIITSIFYFLEPIILTLTLTKLGYNQEYIITEYGIIEGYVIPLITLPNFFTIAISNSLLPTISNLYSKQNIKSVKRKLKQSIYLSLIIGLITIITIALLPNFFLKLIYNTTLGKNYLLTLLPFFILYYVDPPISSFLHGINNSKLLIKNELIGITIKTLSLLILPLYNFGIYSLIIGIILNILTKNILNIIAIKKSI